MGGTIDKTAVGSQSQDVFAHGHGHEESRIEAVFGVGIEFTAAPVPDGGLGKDAFARIPGVAPIVPAQRCRQSGAGLFFHGIMNRSRNCVVTPVGCLPVVTVTVIVLAVIDSTGQEEGAVKLPFQLQVGLALTVAGRAENKIRLNQPPRNVLDREMLVAMVEALDQLANETDPPLLLLTSAGKHFSTGYSIKDIPEEIFHRDPSVRASAPFEQVMDRLVHYPSPVVARVQGDAYGGAVELLACTDLRIAARGIRLGVPPVRLGLVYSHTGLRRMIRGFGSPLVREMLLLGEAITAERAGQAGFWTRLVPAAELDQTTADVMQTVAQGGPQALRGTRRILTLLEEAEILPDSVLDGIGRLRHESWSGEEFLLARDAFIQRKPSPFRNESD